MDQNEPTAVRLVRYDVVCIPGHPPEVKSPELTEFREGDYPGQWRGGLRKGKKTVEIAVSPDRIGRCDARMEAGIFVASAWDFERNADELLTRVFAALEAEIRRFSAKLEASLDGMAALNGVSVPSHKG